MKLFYKYNLIIILLSVIVFPQQKQSGSLKDMHIVGKVLDSSTKHTIEYANVVVFSLKDSSMITGGVTDSKGNFDLLINKIGKFKIEIRFIGYDIYTVETEIKSDTKTINLGKMFIHPTSVTLENVVVEGQRSPVTYEIDKKVINPDQLQTVISGNAADVLANVPSVQVDVEGNVSLRGSQSFTVLIDGRPSVLEPQDALQQISTSQIKSIEIITNPSAKYDPEGTAGIINIILKKNENAGLNGVANANGGMYDSYGGDFLLNYQSNDVKTNLGLSYNQRFFPGDHNQTDDYFLQGDTTTINTIGDINRGRTNYEARGGIEFPLGDNDIINFGGRVGRREHQHSENQLFSEFSVQDPNVFNYSGKTDRSRSGTFYSLNSNYTHNFNSDGHQLLGELFFSNRNSDEYTITSEFDNSVQTGGRKTTETGPSTEFRGKLDYTVPISEVSKFEAGYQGEFDLSDENTSLYDFNPESGEYEIQPQFTNENKYKMIEQTLYSLYSNRIWYIDFQAGLRTEFTYRDIEVPTQNAAFNLDRIDYFPSVHTSYKFSPVTSYMISYSRRIERPHGWALEPFPTWIDANNVRIGNPDLLPEFIDSYETGIQSILINFNLNAEIYYRMTNNKIEHIKTALEENVTLTTFANVGKNYSLGAELMLSSDLFQFWNLNLMGNVYHYKVEGDLGDQQFSNESFNWQTRINNNFKLWSSTQVQFNFNYTSPSVTSQGRWEGYFRSDLSLRQEIIKNILAITFQARDIFGTSKREFSSEGSNFANYNHYDFHTPLIMLNLRYTFNNYKSNQDNKPDDNGNFGSGEEF